MGDKGRAARLGRPVKVEGAQRTQERIFEEASRLFASQGYDRTTVRQIAAAAGLTEGAVYRHYESKQAILDAILEETERRIYAPLPAESDDGGGASVFRGLLAPLPRILASDPLLVRMARIMYAELAHNERIRRYCEAQFGRRAEEHVKAIFRRRMERGEIRACDLGALAQVFNAFRSDWLFKSFVANGDEEPEVEALEAGLEGAIGLFEGLGAAGDTKII